MNNVLPIDRNLPCAESLLAAQAIRCLMSALAPLPLDHCRHERLRRRVLAYPSADVQPEGTRTLRANEGAWLEFAPGVTIKLLRTDVENDRMTALIRMQAGSVLPGHNHQQTEECLVLEGTLFIGAHRLDAGDLHVAPAGTDHAPVSSRAGALMLIHARLCSTDTYLRSS